MDQTKHLHADIIAQCRLNNAKAQMKLYDLYCDAMYNVACRYVKDSFIAEDMVQDAFIKAFQKIEMYHGKVAFGAWLKKIVINNCIDWIKKRKLDLVTMNDEVLSMVDDDNWEVQGNISVEKITNVIYGMDDKYKIVLSLYLLEGYDHREISQILEISEVTSRTQLMRGKNKLKKLLKQHNYA